MPLGGLVMVAIMAHTLAKRKKRKKKEQQERARRAQMTASRQARARGSKSTPQPASPSQRAPRRVRKHPHANPYHGGALAREEARIERRAVNLKF